MSARDGFYAALPTLLDRHPTLVFVGADIGFGYLAPALPQRFPGRVLNVGIREQAMVGVAGGLALAGMRPLVHTFAPFLLERAYEQVKLDLGHQGVGALLVGAGGSYDWPEGGETHFGHRDVALLDTLDGWTVQVPGHPGEAAATIAAAAARDDRTYVRLGADANAAPHARPDGAMTVLRRGTAGTVVAVGPLLDRTLDAVEGLDVTVLYAATVRPFDAATLRATLTAPAVVLVEPYLAGTSVRVAAEALADVPHRIRGLGVAQAESRRYGTVADHDRANGIDRAGIAAAVRAHLSAGASPGGAPTRRGLDPRPGG